MAARANIIAAMKNEELNFNFILFHSFGKFLEIKYERIQFSTYFRA